MVSLSVSHLLDVPPVRLSFYLDIFIAVSRMYAEWSIPKRLSSKPLVAKQDLNSGVRASISVLAEGIFFQGAGRAHPAFMISYIENISLIIGPYDNPILKHDMDIKYLVLR